MPEKSHRPLLPLWGGVLAAAAGGFAYDLGFPGASIWPLAFAGIALALISLIGRSSWGAALVGLVFGLSFYLLQVSWTSLYLGPVPWLALSTLESLFVAGGGVLIALAYRWLPRSSDSQWVRLIALPLIVAGLWCVREFATGSIPYGGFPWGRAALSQSESPFAQVVSWAGSTGLSFVMVALVAGVIEWVRLSGWRRPFTVLPVTGLLVVAMLVPAWQTAPAGELRVASVQGNGPTGYFDEREPGDVLAAQLAATEPILDESGIDVLLWRGRLRHRPDAERSGRSHLRSAERATGCPARAQHGDDSRRRVLQHVHAVAGGGRAPSTRTTSDTRFPSASTSPTGTSGTRSRPT
ncbi:hypothetical protein [Agromyces laixinhei]|uniref:hypothetical protein n=1 Tax=Agromyces laixinhei TaxID=2585717 RepID=UPI0030841947